MSRRSSSARLAAAPALFAYGNSFVGRRTELAELERLRASGAHLITLTGPGGIGKTRLAVEHAASLHAAPDGPRVCFTELAGARTADELCTAVADALGLLPAATAEDAEAATRRIAKALSASGPLLLVLDDFDLLVTAGAHAVRRWLSAAPDLVVLITSREALRLSLEVVYELPPLPWGQPGPGDAASPAAELLADRVRRRRGDAAVGSAAEGASLAEIAAVVEGLPLALELAAARVSALGAVAVRAQLESRLRLAAADARDAPGHERTLRATIAWSWDLLDDEARWTLAACSVFRGGFDLDSAEHLVREVIPKALRERSAGVLEHVHRLRDDSLLRFVERPDDDRPRFECHLDVRAFADERLTELEAAAGCPGRAALAHARIYAGAAQRSAADVGGPGEALALGWLASERQNLLAVVERHRTTPGREWAELALRTALALDELAAVRGALRPQLALVESLLESTADAGVSPLLSSAILAARGELLRRSGELTGARADLEAAIELARAGGDGAAVARATRRMGLVLSMLGELAPARAVLEEALERARAARDKATEARALADLGSVHAELDELERAGECLAAAAEMLRAAGDARAEAHALEGLALTTIDRGDLAGARACLQRALDLRREGDAAPKERLSAGLALLHHLEGSLPEAMVHYRDAIRSARSLAHRGLEGTYRGYLGMALAESGALTDAAAELDAAIEVLEAANERRRLGLVRACRGEVARRQGDAPLAERMVRGARELLGAREDPLAAATELHSMAVDAAGGAEAMGRARDRMVEVERGPLALRADVRLALRSARRALTGDPTEERSPDTALEVHDGGRWFRLPHGETVRCGERRVLRRVLLHLATQRLRAPGEPVPFEVLLEAGWPGERMTVETGRNRLRVSLARLRDLGLGPLIQSADGGYLLDPTVPLALSSQQR